MRVEEVLNNSFGGVFESMTDAKVKKTEKAFAAFLDNAAKGKSQALNDSKSNYITTITNNTTSTNETSNAGNTSAENNSTDKSNSKVSADSDKQNSDVKEIKETDKAVEENTVGSEDEQIVSEIEEAVKTIIAQQLGITIEEVNSILEEMGIDAVDLLDGDNLLQFTMQLNGESDISAMLTNENLLTRYNELSEEIQFAVKDVLDEHAVQPEELPQLIENVKLNIEEAAVISDKTENPIVQADISTVVNEGKNVDIKMDDEVQQDVQQEIETDVVVNNTKPNEKQSNSQFAQSNENNNMPMGMQATQQNFAAEIVNNLNEAIRYTSVNVEEIVNQIVEQIKLQVTEESSSMEMQLYPESYGKLQLHVAVKDGIVTAQMVVENENVKGIIEAQVVQLREQMNNQGIKVEAVEVTIASHEFERNLQQENDAKEQAFEEAQNKASKHRMNLNLSFDGLEEDDVSGMTEAELLERKIMIQSGNRMSIQA